MKVINVTGLLSTALAILTNLYEWFINQMSLSGIFTIVLTFLSIIYLIYNISNTRLKNRHERLKIEKLEREKFQNELKNEN